MGPRRKGNTNSGRHFKIYLIKEKSSEKRGGSDLGTCFIEQSRGGTLLKVTLSEGGRGNGNARLKG